MIWREDTARPEQNRLLTFRTYRIDFLTPNTVDLATFFTSSTSSFPLPPLYATCSFNA